MLCCIITQPQTRQAEAAGAISTPLMSKVHRLTAPQRDCFYRGYVRATPVEGVYLFVAAKDNKFNITASLTLTVRLLTRMTDGACITLTAVVLDASRTLRLLVSL